MLARIGMLVAVIIGLSACAPGPPPDYKLAAMKEVISAFDAGQLGKPPPNDVSCGALKLPDKYAWVSSDGEICVDGSGQHERVVFMDRIGVVDSWTGVVYAADDHVGDDPFGAHFQEITKLESDWYYVVAH